MYIKAIQYLQSGSTFDKEVPGVDTIGKTGLVFCFIEHERGGPTAAEEITVGDGCDSCAASTQGM